MTSAVTVIESETETELWWLRQQLKRHLEHNQELMRKVGLTAEELQAVVSDVHHTKNAIKTTTYLMSLSKSVPHHPATSDFSRHLG
jgi:hypothetical protein